MKDHNTKKRVRAWRWAALCSFLLLVAVSWVVFDSLFAPFGEKSVSVEIPDLRGKRQEDVSFAEWMAVEVEYRYDANTDEGVILSQSPAPGSRRKLTAQKPQCEVLLTVSLGEESVTVPDVLGQDVRETEPYLRGLGLRVETERIESAYPEGCVFEIEPRVGSVLPAGGSVRLTVSAGLTQKSVTVPDVRGLSRSDALVQLWLSQLAVGEVVEELSDAAEGTVIRQSHQPGTRVLAGTRVTLYISRELEE